MARIAVTDGMAPAAVAVLEKAGHEVVLGYIEKSDLLSGALDGFDAIIVRSATKLTADVIEVSQGLSVIGREPGVGVDNIDLEAAGSAGIMVVNAPNASTQSVVELTIGHLLASVRHIPKSDRSMRQDKWEKKAMKGTELSVKCLGLIGFEELHKGSQMLPNLLEWKFTLTTSPATKGCYKGSRSLFAQENRLSIQDMYSHLYTL